ncbi:MAG: metal ABC transporter substrate-binding protein [Clostridia bacterium]|nr:metal ABC transporter substrate-binding protein [Clostridia bacterium]
MKFRHLICGVFFCLLALTGCSSTQEASSDKITVVATLFPQYDFVREIGGDRVDATLLLSAGQESHLYDPSPSDMSFIASSDIFIFTGENMESWAADIASSVGDSVTIVDASEGITLHLNEDDDEDGHSHTYDPHIWLDFDNAKTMCDNIYSALCAASPEDESYFAANLEAYKEKLTEIDEEYAAAFASSSKTLVFGGRFALGYLVRRYNVSYISAYSSCGSESEPSVRDIQTISDFVKENDVKVVYCEEFSDPKVARSIAEGTDAEILVIHSAENTSLDEREDGTTFIDIMEQNLENIKKGLQ